MEDKKIIAKFLKAQLVRLNKEYDKGYLNETEFVIQEICLRDCLLEVGIEIKLKHIDMEVV